MNYGHAFEAILTGYLLSLNWVASSSNNKVTIDQVYAAEAEVKSIEQQLAEAQKNEKVAKAYFNFLLNIDEIKLSKVVLKDVTCLKGTRKERR